MDEIIKPAKLTQLISEQEYDYQSLMNALRSYKDPERKRQDLLRKNVIIRIKKGLYIWHPDYARGTYSKEILANLIYGPSYISLEYALTFWKFIPERVETLTSVTFKKNKIFSTPIGQFTYRYINKEAYPIGVQQIEVKNKRYALMASPEKALLDYLSLSVKQNNIKQNDINFNQLLFEDLRIDHKNWDQLKTQTLITYGSYYRSKTIKLFCRYLKKGGPNA